MCFVVHLQQYLTMLSSMVIMALLLSTILCVNNDWVATSHIFSTMIFVCGMATLLQAGVGSRLVLAITAI